MAEQVFEPSNKRRSRSDILKERAQGRARASLPGQASGRTKAKPPATAPSAAKRGTGKTVISLREAAEMVGRHAQTLRNWDAHGAIVAQRDPNGRMFYSAKQVQQMKALAERNDSRFARAKG